MPTFEEYQAALQARDTIKALVRAEMAAIRPEYRYATVVSIDRPQRECTVQFPEGGDPVTVQMGSLQPVAVGQVVRVDGVSGDRFVADVIGATYNAKDYPDNPSKHIFNYRGGSDYGGLTSGWNNWVFNASGWQAGYDQSSGANGVYKESRIWMEPGYWFAYPFLLKGPNIGNMWLQVGMVGQGLGWYPNVVDGYAAAYTPFVGNFGFVPILEAGLYTFRVLISGKNGSSSSYFGLLTEVLVSYGGPIA